MIVGVMIVAMIAEETRAATTGTGATILKTIKTTATTPRITGTAAITQRTTETNVTIPKTIATDANVTTETTGIDATTKMIGIAGTTGGGTTNAISRMTGRREIAIDATHTTVNGTTIPATGARRASRRGTERTKRCATTASQNARSVTAARVPVVRGIDTTTTKKRKKNLCPS